MKYSVNTLLNADAIKKGGW